MNNGVNLLHSIASTSSQSISQSNFLASKTAHNKHQNDNQQSNDM